MGAAIFGSLAIKEEHPPKEKLRLIHSHNQKAKIPFAGTITVPSQKPGKARHPLL
jgi:hypothetical protein